MYTKMDYTILKAITTKNDRNKGLSLGNGTTYDEIIRKTGASASKVRKTISNFIEDGFIQRGLNDGRLKTFILTRKGIEELQNVKKNIALEGDIYE